jgi:hypothetical protein
MKKWLKYLGFAAIGFVIIGIIAVASDDSKAVDPADDEPLPSAVIYEVAKREEQYSNLEYRLIINERTDKKSIIEAVRRLRIETKWEGELVCFFSIKTYYDGAAWASCSYLPKCEECATDKDVLGDPVRFQLIGATRGLADSLRKLTFDSIPNKTHIASYIEDLPACKTELYTVGDNSSKILRVQLFNNGGRLLQWFRLRPHGDQDRYYFDDDNENYMLIDHEAQQVKFLATTDHKVWQSFGME